MLKRTRRLGVVVVLAVGATLATLGLTQGTAGAIPANAPKTGMVCNNGTAGGGNVTFNLVAKKGYIQTPDGNSVFMWSYANADAPDSGAFQSPGPVLCVHQGDTVVVNLHNTLPEATSIVFPGQDGHVSTSGGSAGLFTQEAGATSGDVSYSFPAGQPGTYLYESGTDVAKQVEMGLQGALVVRPTGHDDYAYGDAATQFDPGREYLLLLSDIDPDLHHAVETGKDYDINALRSRYFAINGREFPDTIQDNGSGLLPSQPYGALVRIQPNNASNTKPALVRVLNGGLLNHPFHPHGNHTTEIAQDGRPVTPTEHFGETVASGQTQDFLLRWDDPDHWDPTGNPLPVAQPNYRDLTFKDGNTFYSGSPYLGYKGTLPTGTVSQNICGEWYFPWHSHALNEFTNFDQGFGGMGTLLRVDPPGGCVGAAATTNLFGAVLKAGTVGDLAVSDSSYYQVAPKTTVTTAFRNASIRVLPVASSAKFPTTTPFYVRVGTEVMRVDSGAGTTSWNVTRGQLGTTATTHPTRSSVSALATDWYAGFTGVKAGSNNLKVTYKGKNCDSPTSATCTDLTTNLPQQTVKVCDWTVSGASGCATASSNGWVTLPAPPAQPQDVGSTEVSSAWSIPGSAAHYIGTGANKGQVRVLVHTQRWTASSPTPFSTWGNLMQIGYDAP